MKVSREVTPPFKVLRHHTSQSYSFNRSKMTGIQISEVGAKTCTSQGGTMKFRMLRDIERMATLNKITVVKNQKCRCGDWLKIKNPYFLYGDNARKFASSKIVSCTSFI
jgi:hypothetical protein